MCCPVNQAVVGAAGHSNTGSCIVVGALKDRGVDAASGLLRVAPLALNLEPIANVAPPVDARRISRSRSRGWGHVRRRPVRLNRPRSIIWARPRRGASVRRPGDWTCARCSAHNFASRQSCFKCKRSKAGGDSEGGDGFSPVARARWVRTPAVRAREVSEQGIGYAKSAGLTTLPLDRVASNASTGRPVMRCHRRNPKVLPAPAAPPQRISEAAIGFARAVRATTSRADPRASDALAPRESTTATQVNGNRYRVLKSTTEYCHEKSSNFHNHHHG